MGPAGSYVKWMPALLLLQWPGPNDDQPYRRIIFRNISRNTEKKISCFHLQKGFDFWMTSPTTGTRSFTGALPIRPIGGLPKPRYFTPGRCSERVTVVEPQKSTQKFLGLTVIFMIIIRLLLTL